MKITIVIPPAKGVATGNRCTSSQWEEILRDEGHDVTVANAWEGRPCDLLIALNAVRSFRSISGFRGAHPTGKLVVVLTGTDIYPALGEGANEAIAMADRLVVLQEKAWERVPAGSRGKTRTIIQSATVAEPPPRPPEERSTEPFEICVAGHLRDVKDPMRAALASRLLPQVSRVEIRHFGALLDAKFRGLVDDEERENPRYRWMGEVDPGELKRQMGKCQATVLSSVNEGGPRVLGESIVQGTPVLATEIDGAVGLLGERYPGYFSVGDTEGLAALMARLENDNVFRDHLRQVTGKLKERFGPERENEAWAELLNEI